jgi:tRNA pseudouridine55 synthase
LQVPPAFSAKHVAGTRSHVLARRGEAVALRPVEVHVDAIEVLDWSPPDLTIEASVGRGTYVRALARDLGDKLGIPAHCAELRRLAIGTFSVDCAIAPSAVTADALLDPSALLPGLPSMVLDETGAQEVGFGRPVAQATAIGGAGALVAGDGRLLAVAEGRNGWWYPVVVLEAAS